MIRQPNGLAAWRAQPAVAAAGEATVLQRWSDVQGFVVDVVDSLVGPGETIPRFVDLPLREILDHEQMLNGIVRLAQFAVGRYDRGVIDHVIKLLPLRSGG